MKRRAALLLVTLGIALGSLSYLGTVFASTIDSASMPLAYEIEPVEMPEINAQLAPLAASMVVTKSAVPTVALQGDTVAFSITIGNSGNEPIYSVQVTENNADCSLGARTGDA